VCPTLCITTTGRNRGQTGRTLFLRNEFWTGGQAVHLLHDYNRGVPHPSRFSKGGNHAHAGCPTFCTTTTEGDRSHYNYLRLDVRFNLLAMAKLLLIVICGAGETRGQTGRSSVSSYESWAGWPGAPAFPGFGKGGKQKRLHNVSWVAQGFHPCDSMLKKNDGFSH
jgi:hypothetical protein